MIPIYLEIPDKAKKIINKNVGYIFESLICTCEGLSYKEILSDINNKKNELDLTIKNLNTKNSELATLKNIIEEDLKQILKKYKEVIIWLHIDR